MPVSAAGSPWCWPRGGSPPLWRWPQILAELVGDDADMLDQAGRGSSEPERFAMFRGVATALRRADGSLLVVLDDAHDAEPAAPLLLRFLVGALERAVLKSVRAAGGIGVSGGEAVPGCRPSRR
jgi:hypothetical protein